MSRPASICAVLALATLAAGCATTPDSTARVGAAPSASSERSIEQDRAYMYQVEQIARRRGIGVTWVNPPMKRKVRSAN